MSKHNQKKLVATASCLAGVMLTGFSAVPMVAQTLSVNNVMAPGYLVEPETLPAPGTTGSISVVKHLPGDPMDQITEFSAQQILSIWGKSIDLTTEAGWEVLEEIGVFTDDPEAAIDPDRASLPLSTVFVAMTTGNATVGPLLTAATNPLTGRAEFTGLPVGLYLVQEIGNAAIKAEPILVMLPYPSPASLDRDDSWDLNPVPTPKVLLLPGEKIYDAALKIWSQRVYEPTTDGGWREVWNFDTAADSAKVLRDADGAPMGPKPPIQVQIGDAVQYELQVHNQGTETIHVDELTFHSVPGLVLTTDTEIHPGQQNHVWEAMPEHDNLSHLYVVPENHIVLNPGEYHQFPFAAVVTPDISLDGRFEHWASDPELFDIWAEVSGISALNPPLELQRKTGLALGFGVPVTKLTDIFAEDEFGWVPVEDYDSNHHRDNWFNADSYIDNEIWEDQRNNDGDKDNHDGDHAKLVEKRKPTVNVDTSTNGSGDQGSVAEASSAAAQAARKARLYRTGVQVAGLVAGASLLVAGVAMLRRRADGKA